MWYVQTNLIRYTSVPTDGEELEGIRKQLSQNIIHEESLNECNINVNDIDCAIKQLNKEKSDSDKSFYSDHIIMSIHRFRGLLALLINTMLIHGYNVDNLLVSITASIPKDLRSSLNKAITIGGYLYVVHFVS